MRSMTGFGRREVGTENGHFIIEIRSVNNRYLDAQIKLPRGLSFLEPRVKKAVQERCSRGRVDVFITRTGDRDSSRRLVVDDARAAQYVELLKGLKARFGLEGDVGLALVAGMQDVIAVAEVQEDMEAAWALLSPGLAQALDELDRMRIDEGAALVRDIAGRLELIDRIGSSISAQSPQTVENARKRMAERLARLLNEQPDPIRLAQEIAILAERTDVTEEITRLSSHLSQFRAMLADSKGEAIGRKLDFLLQEMGREANTIASKAMDAAIVMEVVQVKAELEKIREQVQNLE